MKRPCPQCRGNGNIAGFRLECDAFGLAYMRFVRVPLACPSCAPKHQGVAKKLHD